VYVLLRPSLSHLVVGLGWDSVRLIKGYTMQNYTGIRAVEHSKAGQRPSYGPSQRDPRKAQWDIGQKFVLERAYEICD
jgi:hypothetical protein